MPYVIETLPAVNGGVTERPPRLRRADTCDVLLNGFPEPGMGVRKRPRIEDLDLISEDPEAFDGGLLTTIRPVGDAYRLAVGNGDLKALRMDGTEVDILFPEGKDYLTGDQGFRSVSSGKTTWITNRATTVETLDERSPKGSQGVLLYVRQADYGTTYFVTVDSTSVRLDTPAGSSAQQRPDLDTGEIAAQIRARLLADLPSGYQIEVFGSTLRIARSGFPAPNVSATDGLADRGILIIPGTVQRIEDLPLRAPDGYVVEIIGDPGSEDDNFWAKFDDRGDEDQDGVWVEIAEPGARTQFDPETMPHRLVFQGQTASGEVRSLPELPAQDRGDRSPSSPQGWNRYYQADWPNRLELPVGFAEVALDPAEDAQIRWDNQYVLRNVPSSFEGETRFAEAAFSVDTRLMPPGSSCFVRLVIDSTLISQRLYQSGEFLQNELLSGTFTVPGGGGDLKLELVYNSFEPGIDDQVARVVAKGTAAQGGVWHYGWTQTILAFPNFVSYPEGWTLEFTLDSEPFSLTLPAATGSGGAAASLAALVDADTDFSASASGRFVTIETDPSGDAPIYEVTGGWNHETTAYLKDFWNTLGDLTGQTAFNRTDGSSGTITDSGPSFIEVSAGLSGGQTNRFNRGDLIEVAGTGEYFVFQAAPWEPRKAGKENFPSFVGDTIQGLFVFKDRLGFLSGTSVIMSRAGDHLNFFRHTARLVRDDDPIDVESAGSRTALFHTPIEWDSGLFLMSTQGLYALGPVGVNQPLTPRTASLEFRSSIPNDSSVPPVVAGSRLYYVRKGPNGLQVMVSWIGDNLRVQSDILNRDLPTYISGTPLSMAADSAHGLVFVLTDEALFCQRFIEDPREGVVYSAWSRWELPGDQKIIEFSEEGVLTVISVTDIGVSLGEIDLSGSQEVSDVTYADSVGNLSNPVNFKMEWKSPWLLRDERGHPVPGELRTQYVDIHIENTYYMEITVSGTWGIEVVEKNLGLSDKVIRLPIGRKDFELRIDDHQAGSLRITGITFEGQFYPAQHDNLPRQESA
jgi:hypothetical protein